MKKKYIIRLSAEERQNLTDLVRKGKIERLERLAGKQIGRCERI